MISERHFKKLQERNNPREIHYYIVRDEFNISRHGATKQDQKELMAQREKLLELLKKALNIKGGKK